MSSPRSFVTLGMFIIDQFSFDDEHGVPTGRSLPDQIGGGGTYAAIGARIWLPEGDVGMIVDRGPDFPSSIDQQLRRYGENTFFFRSHTDSPTTRALNAYRGEHRGFKYLTPRIRITPSDLKGTSLERPRILHFICSPTRAQAIVSEIEDDWDPITVYEPIPDRCVPEELSSLKAVLPRISILSPNAEEALSLLSMPPSINKRDIESAADQFLEMGVGAHNSGWVVIRSGPLGAYVKARERQGKWVDAFWTAQDSEKIVDVTGAGNSFLGGLAAGMILAEGNVYEAVFYGSISAAFVIEQPGIPTIGDNGEWNRDLPSRRLEQLRKRHETGTN